MPSTTVPLSSFSPMTEVAMSEHFRMEVTIERRGNTYDPLEMNYLVTARVQYQRFVKVDSIQINTMDIRNRFSQAMDMFFRSMGDDRSIREFFRESEREEALREGFYRGRDSVSTPF